MKRIIVLAVAGLAAASSPSAGHAQSGYELYQRALVKERSSGQVLEAIELYRRVADEFGSDRLLAAQALLRVAAVQETLGDPQAAGTYGRIVRDFADQTELADRARARLAALQPEAPEESETEQVARLLFEDDTGCIWGMDASPDGSRLAYDDLCEGKIFVMDLVSGETRQVPARGRYSSPVWSPDGTRLAVAGGALAAAGSDGPGRRLRLLDPESGVVEVPPALDGLRLGPRDWSSDGEHLTGTLGHGDGTASSVVVSLSTGELVTLSERANVGSLSARFSPDGRFVAFADLVDGEQDIYVLDVRDGSRTRVTTTPGPERGALWSPDGTTLLYDNDDGAWAIDVSGGEAQGPPRLVRNEPFGASAWTEHGLYFGSSNTRSEVYRVPVDPATGRARGPSERMPSVHGFQWIAWSPDMSRIASSNWEDREHIEVAAGSSVTAYSVGEEILTSNLWWSPDGREILFTTAARAQRDKRVTVFVLDTDDGRVRELFPRLENIHHVHVSPDRSRMVFLRKIDGRLAGEVVVSDLGDPDGVVLATGLDPEGRLSTRYGQPRFSPDGTHVLFLRHRGRWPNDLVSSVWVAATDGSEPAREVVSMSLITWVHWDPSGRFMAFQGIASEEEGEAIRVVEVATGATTTVLELRDSEDLQLRGWSPDGRWLAITRSVGRREVWVIEDVLGDEDAR